MSREFRDTAGVSWQAKIVSHGTSSSYLNPKVHRPIVQFSCTNRILSRRYAPLPLRYDTLDDLDAAALLGLFAKARPH